MHNDVTSEGRILVLVDTAENFIFHCCPYLCLPDAFEDRVSDDVIRNILQSSADANMNIVRNWGGGIYQHDSFYSIADELGCVSWKQVHH